MPERINLGRIMPIHRGDYSSNTTYEKMDVVKSGGATYWCKQQCTGVTPPNDTYWVKLADKGEDGTNGQDGTDGLDAYQPFKGWYDTSSSLSTAFPTPQVGDYAYVVGASSSDPVTIYKCATAGTWAASSSTFNPANNQEFASGQSLNTVNIVDNLNSSSATDVLSAKQGKELKSAVDALGPKIYYETAVDLAYKNLSYSKESEKVISPASSNSRVYYAPISQGDNFRITATYSQSKDFIYGFTSEIPVVDTQVSGAVVLNTSSVDVTVVAPMSGYIVISKYATYFTDLTVSVIASKIDRLEDTVSGLQNNVNSISFVNIKHNVVTLKRINSDGSVTDATTTTNRTLVADVSDYIGKTIFLDGQLAAIYNNVSYCWWVFHDADGNVVEKSNTSGSVIQKYTNIPVVVPDDAVTLYVQGKEDNIPNAKEAVNDAVAKLVDSDGFGTKNKLARTFPLDFGTISISRGVVATSTNYNNNACRHTVNYIRVHKSIEIKNLQNTTCSIRVFFYDKDYSLISSVVYQDVDNGLTSIVISDIPINAVWFRLSFEVHNSDYSNRVKYLRTEVEIESEWDNGEETSKAPYIEYFPFMYSVISNIPIKLSEYSYSTKSVFGYDEGLLHLPPTYTPKGKPTPLIFYIHGDAERYTMGQSTFSGHMKMQQCWSDAGFAQVDLDLIPSYLNQPTIAATGGTRDDLECLSAAWEFLVNHFNIDKRGFYLIGRSRGGQCVIEVLGKGGAIKLPIIAAISMAGANTVFEYSVNLDATENEWQLWCNAHGLPTNGRPSWGNSQVYSSSKSFLTDNDCYNFVVNNWDLWCNKALTGWGLITKNTNSITPRDYFDNYIYPYIQANETVTPAIEQFFEQMIENMEAKSPIPLRLDWCYGDQTNNGEYFVSATHRYTSVLPEILLNTPASLVEYRRWDGVDESNPYGETNPHFAENMIFYNGDLTLPNGAVTTNPSKVTMEWLIWCMGKDPRYQGMDYTLPWQ